MLGDSKIMAFAATIDAAHAKTFYEEVLGLRLLEDGPYALVFDAGGTMLRVQRVRELKPPSHTALGWEVPDLAAVIGTLAGRGVVFEHYDFLPQDALGIWTTPDGSKVAWFKDPDGNILSLTQLARR